MLAWVVLLLLSAELCYLSPVCFPGQSATDCLQQQRQQQERQPLIVARQGQLCYYECGNEFARIVCVPYVRDRTGIAGVLLPENLRAHLQLSV
jgi:hypothetical protein